MRLRAIREYTSQHTCEHTPPKTSTSYIVTFAKDNGGVVADCYFFSKEEADFVVDAVNQVYKEKGGIIKSKSIWDDIDE